MSNKNKGRNYSQELLLSQSKDQSQIEGVLMQKAKQLAQSDSHFQNFLSQIRLNHQSKENSEVISYSSIGQKTSPNASSVNDPPSSIFSMPLSNNEEFSFQNFSYALSQQYATSQFPKFRFQPNNNKMHPLIIPNEKEIRMAALQRIKKQENVRYNLEQRKMQPHPLIQGERQSESKISKIENKQRQHKRSSQGDEEHLASSPEPINKTQFSRNSQTQRSQRSKQSLENETRNRSNPSPFANQIVLTANQRRLVTLTKSTQETDSSSQQSSVLKNNINNINVNEYLKYNSTQHNKANQNTSTFLRNSQNYEEGYSSQENQRNEKHVSFQRQQQLHNTFSLQKEKKPALISNSQTHFFMKKKNFIKNGAQNNTELNKSTFSLISKLKLNQIEEILKDCPPKQQKILLQVLSILGKEQKERKTNLGYQKKQKEIDFTQQGFSISELISLQDILDPYINKFFPQIENKNQGKNILSKRMSTDNSRQTQDKLFPIEASIDLEMISQKKGIVWDMLDYSKAPFTFPEQMIESI